MLLNNMFAFIGGSLMGMSKLCRSFEMMILGRFIIGAYCGELPPTCLLAGNSQNSLSFIAHLVSVCLWRFGVRPDTDVRRGNFSHESPGGPGHTAPAGYRHRDPHSSGVEARYDTTASASLQTIFKPSVPAQVLGLESLLGSEHLWPVLVGLTVVPTVLQMALLPFCPESPRFLYIVRCQEHHAKSGE